MNVHCTYVPIVTAVMFYTDRVMYSNVIYKNVYLSLNVSKKL